MICRACGRIADLPLTELDRFQLEQLTERRPGGWSVDGITFSLTGACPKCLQGSA